MPSRSFGEFTGLLASVDQLIHIHRKLQQGGGRRHEQDAIHRAGVVPTGAAWQAYIEKILSEALLLIENNVAAPVEGVPPPAWATGSFLVRKAAIKKSIADFNTPNSENVRRLFKESLDFDPWPSWAWHAARRNWDSHAVRIRTNHWLKIRHSIVHGFSLPDDMEWIQGDGGASRLTLRLLKECLKHFRFLAAKTDDGFAIHLINQHRIPAPW